MRESEYPGILVGVDSSAAANDALVWAAAEAAARRRPLTVCHVTRFVPVDEAAPGQLTFTDLRLRGQELVELAAERAADVAAVPRVHRLVLEGVPAVELACAGEYADMIVVGGSGGGLAGAVLGGSVGAALLARTPAPVVVVRGSARRAGPVLVGVDDEHRSEAALGFAFDHADRHGLRVRAVRAYHGPLPTGPAGHVPLVSAASAASIARRSLHDALRPWQEKYPDVTVEPITTTGSVGRELIDRSATASLVVVGSRRHGPAVGLLLNSTSQAVLRHAEAPVAVVS